MAKKYKCHASHNQVLEQYAMNIFDSTKRFHGLGERDRLLLQIAVTLHACGKFISMKNSNEMRLCPDHVHRDHRIKPFRA